MKRSVIYLVLIMFVAILGCDKFSRSDVSTVKDGLLDFDKSLTVGKAFENYKYFKEVKWEAIKTDNGKRLVNTYAKLDLAKHPRFNEDLSKFKYFDLHFQFLVNQDNTFQLAWCGAAAEKHNGEKFEPQKEANLQQCMNELKNIYNNDPGYSEDEAREDRNKRAIAALKHAYTAAQAYISD